MIRDMSKDQAIRYKLEYTPHTGIDGRPNQMDFHLDRFKFQYRICMAGKRGGKTECGCAETWDWLLKYPGVHGMALEPDLKRVDRVLLPKLKRQLGIGNWHNHPLISRFSKHPDKTIEFTNGSVLWFGSTDDPESAEGTTLDFVFWDESRLTKRFEDAWDSLFSRLSGTGALPIYGIPSMWLTTTPGVLHSEMYERFAPAGENYSPELSLKIYSWHLFDNTDLSNHYKRQMDLGTINEAKRQSFLFGGWSTAGIGTIPIDLTVHVIDDDRVPPPQSRAMVAYGVDWGYDHPFAITVGILDEYGVWYLVDEFVESYFEPEMRDDEVARLVEKWGDGPVTCGADRPEFINLFRRAGLDAKPRKRNNRDESIDIATSKFHIHPDGSTGVFVHKRCKMFIREAVEYDPRTKVNDDAFDSYRYLIEAELPRPGKFLGTMARNIKRRYVASGYKRSGRR